MRVSGRDSDGQIERTAMDKDRVVLYQRGDAAQHARKYERRGGGLRPMKRRRTAAIASRGQAGIIRELILIRIGQSEEATR